MTMEEKPKRYIYKVVTDPDYDDISLDVLRLRVQYQLMEKHECVFQELTKESCKEIHKLMFTKWLETQEQEVDGRIVYGEYAVKAWQAAQKNDPPKPGRRQLTVNQRYDRNMNSYYKTHSDHRFGTIFRPRFSGLLRLH